MIRVQQQDFDVGAEITGLTRGRTDIGAVVSFVGRVRGAAGDDAADDAVRSMTLEHYPAMTEKRMAETEARARARWPLSEVLIVHRYGRLAPGDNIVLVVTCSTHRQAAFEACHFLIDWLKTDAPFWKHEETGAGDRWVAARAEDTSAAARWTDKTRAG